MSKVKPVALPPDTVIGGYRIIRKVAAGGFGLVYLALDSEGRPMIPQDNPIPLGPTAIPREAEGRPLTGVCRTPTFSRYPRTGHRTRSRRPGSC